LKTIIGIIFVSTLLVAAVMAQQAPGAAGSFDVELATRAYLDTLGVDARAASDAYFEGGYWLTLWDWLYTLLLAWVLLRFGLSAKMRDLSERATRFVFLRSAIFAALFIVVVFLMSLPLTIYRDFIREHAYGLSNLSFLAWLGEGLIGLAVSVVLGSLAIAVIYLVIRKAPRTWPVWTSVTGILMIAFLIAIAPVFISPLFNDYRPLEDGALKARILSLARANGVPASDVYEFDASRQTTRISANVSGLFGTTRISLNDNRLNRTSREGVEAVMAHEIGHYALNHIPNSLVYFALILAGGIAFIRYAFDRMSRPAWGVRGIGDTAGLPLMMALFATYLFVMTPVLNTIVRVSEAEADIFGLNAARQPDGWAEAVLTLSDYRKMEPGYWEEILFFDHPSGYRRIRMAMQWKKENLVEGKPD